MMTLCIFPISLKSRNEAIVTHSPVAASLNVSVIPVQNAPRERATKGSVIA